MKDREKSLTLEILQAIDERSDVTQRTLARRMNVALGLANSYLKRCVRKGLVKIHQAPANRYLYYLTPQGFGEKSRLTAQYLTISFAFYRKASDSCVEALRGCRQRGWRRLVLCGVSDLAEIAALHASEHAIEIAGFLDRQRAQSVFLNHPVRGALRECEPFDACLLTDLDDPFVVFEQLAAEISEERIVVPTILGVRRS